MLSFFVSKYLCFTREFLCSLIDLMLSNNLNHLEVVIADSLEKSVEGNGEQDHKHKHGKRSKKGHDSAGQSRKFYCVLVFLVSLSFINGFFWSYQRS